METNQEIFRKKLLETFRIEADESLRVISSQLVDLENDSNDGSSRTRIESIFREAHNLKGAARAVNALEIETICQSLENVLSSLKDGSINVAPALFDQLHEAVDTIAVAVPALETPNTLGLSSRSAEVSRQLDNILSTPAQPSSTMPYRELPPEPVKNTSQSDKPSKPEKTSAEMVRVPTARLRSMLLQIEALRAPTLGLDEQLVTLRELEVGLSIVIGEHAALGAKLRGTSRESDLHRTDEASGGRAKAELSHLLDLLEQCGKKIDTIAGKLTSVLRLAEKDHRTLAGISASLLQDTRELSMAPFSSAFEAFPKLVRDLAHACGKEVELLIPRSEIQGDRRILGEIKTPLIHILRNCVDHGIESPSDREKKGKPRKGTIAISILPKDGDKVEISVSDNGAGIDVDKVRAAAGIGLPGQSASLTDEEALQLIFQSGLSTSFMVTNLSGRGLGLAIAREKVEKLGGSLTVESARGVGTKFRLTVPLTLAALRGVLVRSGESLFVIPSTHVERVIRFRLDDIKTVENRETISFDGKAVSLARLYDVLSIKAGIPTGEETLHVLVLHAGGERIAFLVDEILSEQEVIAKPLGRQLSRARHLTAATVLGSGRMVPIINVHELMKSAAKSKYSFTDTVLPAAKKRRSVLIAEDSITSRTLMKNILESAGYEVKTAVDGLEAFTSLKENRCDIVVSDVEMPRMTGFDLTVKIRADQRLAATPVVLVTALDSREDRERGLDVGANAYIVKSSLDQSDLLRTIQRLI